MTVPGTRSLKPERRRVDREFVSPTVPRPRRPDEVARWLSRAPSLSEVRAVYPAEWDQVQRELAGVVQRGDAEAIKAYLVAAATPRPATPGHAPRQQAVVSDTIRRYLTVEATRQASLAARTGVRSGSVRFGLVNGWVLQRLLFEHGLRRKPVNLPAFRLLWPLLPQRRYLMPLVMPEGIYCFYTARLVRALAGIIGDRTCLEIAAGDGTLSRFLAGQGVAVTATDDFSWGLDAQADHRPEAAAAVTRRDAAAALRTHAPEVVICSWPPPGNLFERQVFTTPSVEHYVLVTSRHEVAAGDWKAYRGQTTFDFAEEARLSRLVVPADAGGAVYVFTRNSR